VNVRVCVVCGSWKESVYVRVLFVDSVYVCVCLVESKCQCECVFSV